MTPLPSSKAVSACCGAPMLDFLGYRRGASTEYNCTRCDKPCSPSPHKTQGEEKTGNYCEKHRKGGINSSTVSAKPCDVCGATPSKSGYLKPDTTPTQPSETVKAWAIVNPEGKIICVNMMETLAWEEAQELKIEYKRVLENDGFRCIQVVVEKYEQPQPKPEDSCVCCCDEPAPCYVKHRPCNCGDPAPQPPKEPKYAYWYEYNALHKLVDALQEKVAALEQRL